MSMILASSPPPEVRKPAVQPPEAPPTEEIQTLRSVLAELARLIEEIQTRRKQAIDDVAQQSVELGVAIAERLLGAEIAADRQRLDCIVLKSLERMPAARAVTIWGHPDDLNLLQRQLGQNAELQPYQQILTFRQEKSLPRGQWKLEADEWFVEWDTQRSLADLRDVLLEEAAADE